MYIWKSRVTDACWAATHKIVFDITDDECKLAIETYEEAMEKKSKSKKADAVVGC